MHSSVLPARFSQAHAFQNGSLRLCQAEPSVLLQRTLEPLEFLDSAGQKLTAAIQLPGGPGPRTVARALTRAATAVARTRKLAGTLAG